MCSIKLLKWPLGLAGVCVLTACGGNPAANVDKAASAAAPPAAASPYQAAATFQEIMDSEVDFSSDYIWKAVATIVDAKGVHEFQPRNDAEWHEFRRRAVILMEAANLIDVPGRRIANGDKTVEDGQPLPTAEIQKRYDAQHDQLVGFASALRDVSAKLVAAADKKDVAAVTDLGGVLDEVCEDCHKVFWYPDEPPSPSQK
jgi:hypothetical protein